MDLSFRRPLHLRVLPSQECNTAGEIWTTRSSLAISAFPLPNQAKKLIRAPQPRHLHLPKNNRSTGLFLVLRKKVSKMQSLRLAGGFLPPMSRARFRISGSDRLRYLNSQLTNDLRKSISNSALPCC